ncbi:MAG: MobA/MobL family protein, partial [Mangrovicoccus sp.]
MAIYSLQHSAVGRTTHEPGTAGAHIRYITRTSAKPSLICARMPHDRYAAERWINTQEDADRKNARVCDKFIIALPRELNALAKSKLVRSFAERLTKGRAPWYAAIHGSGKDRHNPHVHLVIRDRDIETGKRVIGMSEKGSTEIVRKLWSDVANDHLAMAGFTARISHETLEAQGIERKPQTHRGPETKSRAANDEVDMDVIARDAPESAPGAKPDPEAAKLHQIKQLCEAVAEYRHLVDALEAEKAAQTKAAELELIAITKQEQAAADQASLAAKRQDVVEAEATYAALSPSGRKLGLGFLGIGSAKRQQANQAAQALKIAQQAEAVVARAAQHSAGEVQEACHRRDTAWADVERR